MPIYEYYCADCRKRVSVFFRSISAASQPVCPQCGGVRLERRFSRVVVRRGGSSRAAGVEADEFGVSGDFDAGDELGGYPGDEDFGADFGLDEDADPREVARWARHMSAEMGEPLDPELETALADMERGADPEEVISRLEDAEPEPEG